MKNLFVRADASPQIGTGHVMRCLALAQAWQDQGGNVTFLSFCESESLRRRIIDEGFAFVPIESPHPKAGDLSQVLFHIESHTPHAKNHAPSWLVLDGYHFTPEYQKAIRQGGIRLLVIDDMNHLPRYYADILLNQNIHAPDLRYRCGEDTKLLLGSEYVLLRREFLKSHGFERKIPEKAQNILVTFGGADPDNVTLKAIRALKLLGDPDLQVKVVIGPANQNIDRVKREASHLSFPMQIVIAVSDMAGLMHWADLAITAGGSTVWELLLFRLPIIMMTLAENQQPIAEKLHNEGLALNLGRQAEVSVSALAGRIQTILEDRNFRWDMASKAADLIDGQGTARVCRTMRH